MSRARILADYVAGGTTAAEFDYMDGVTSNVQTQMNTKAPLASPAFTGTPTGITAAHITSGALPVGVTGGSGLTHLASNPTVTLGSNATFPANHIVNIGFGEIASASIPQQSNFVWTQYLVTLDMTNPIAGNILYATSNTGGHCDTNVSWCQTRIYVEDDITDKQPMSVAHAAAYFNTGTSFPGGGGSITGKYVIPSGAGDTITVRTLAYINSSATWSVNGTSLMCWEVQG